MADLIPAAPGWYLRETDGDSVVLDPIAAWTTGVDADGEAVLLPYISGGPTIPPLLINVDDFQYWKRRAVYLPNHDPATED
ncbi:hypothetical protein ACIQVK_21385 [Streptomyces sp. NPDC090493]|uniref:hypothetical protein n=1 Tax=Streptomyces sp. NPDC090493 TaxID=3365964 RepID=UPI00380AD85F